LAAELQKDFGKSISQFHEDIYCRYSVEHFVCDLLAAGNCDVLPLSRCLAAAGPIQNSGFYNGCRL